MHELPFAKSIYKSVMEVAEANSATHIHRVVLEVGVLRDFVPELVQRYWNYISKGSIAEGSEIVMNTIDASAVCDHCGTTYPIDTHNFHDAHCPSCGHNRGRLLTGRELKIINIEIS